MSASRALCSRGVCHLGHSLARRRGPVAFYTSAADTSQATAPGGASRPSHGAGPVDDALKSNRKEDRPGPKAPERGSDDAMAIFNDVVNKGTPAKKDKGSKRSAWMELEVTAELSRLELQLVSQLNGIMGKQLTAKTRFSAFQKETWPRIRNVKKRHGFLPPHLFSVVNGFMGKIVDELISEKCLGQSGNARALSEVYDLISTPDLRIRSGLIIGICTIVSENQYAGNRDHFIFQLIDMWKSISQMKRPSQRGRDLQFALPTPEYLLDVIKGPKATTSVHGDTPRWDPETRALSAIFKQFPTGHARYAIPGLLATLATFSDPSIKPTKLMHVAPLLELSRIALEQCNVDDDFIDRVFNAEDIRFHKARIPELRDLVKDRWPLVKMLLNNKDAIWRRGLESKPDRKAARIKTLAHFHKLLRSAHATDNKGVIISLWADLRTTMYRSPSLVSEMRSDPEFMDFWHFVWCATKVPEKLEEAQKVMRQINLSPTIKTYTAMMHGWKLAREPDKINAMWDSLISSGVALDTHAWTERISGLIELGNLQKGIDTMAQMLSTWKEASKDSHRANTAVQPTIEVVNAAFKPLIRIDKKAAYDVLAWAGREGINPNILTYNILLSECFRNKQPDEDVQNILKAMRDQNIQPDGATFTIILEEALGALNHATVAQQVAAIDQILADLKSAGIRPNLETYGKMLHSVASLSNGADDAVETVLNHMRSTGHAQISPHMVLILINRALSRGQQNPGAIRAILERHGFTSIHTGDQPLWEQVISAYCTLGDTKAAMELFDQLAREARPLTRQSSLRDLLLALVERDDMETARRVVSDTLANLRDDNPPERRWKHHFWHQAYQYGLLDWSKAPANLRRVVDDSRYLREMEEK